MAIYIDFNYTVGEYTCQEQMWRRDAKRVRFGITIVDTMKTAISVDDALIKKADSVARKLGLSRSRLFSIAVERFLRERRNEEMLERLNRVYAADPNPEERRIAASFKTKFRSAAKDSW